MDAADPRATREHELDYYLAIPYLLVLESVEHEDGEWLRRAEYPELPGCVAEAYSAVEAVDRLEEERIRLIHDLWEQGAPIPAPRPPLAVSWDRLDERRLSFARWLVREGQISDQ
jgi:predicted RNase H-like HicB family nuclease